MNAEKASFHRIRICHSPFLRTAALLLACILSAGSLSACSLAENREVVRLKEENGPDPADGPDARPAGSGNIARQTACLLYTSPRKHSRKRRLAQRGEKDGDSNGKEGGLEHCPAKLSFLPGSKFLGNDHRETLGQSLYGAEHQKGQPLSLIHI